jgi:transcriptional regulator of acetoin/glycerol metabolism
VNVRPAMRKKDDLSRTTRRDADNALPVHVGMTLQEAEKVLIAATVQSTDGNMRRAARVLGIDRSTLYQKTRLYGLVTWTRELRKEARNP